MKKYSIITFLCVLSLNALRESNNLVSIEKKLTVVFAYHAPDKKDREGKEHLRTLQKAFGSFERDHTYKKMGVSVKNIDIGKNPAFEYRYLDSAKSDAPMVLFFERGKLLDDETLNPSSDKELIKTLGEKLEDPKSKVGKIVSDLQDDYEDKKEKDAEAARLAARSIMYPSVWDAYSGFYSPYYPYRTYWGFGFGHRGYW